jgi:hypothetical protein
LCVDGIQAVRKSSTFTGDRAEGKSAPSQAASKNEAMLHAPEAPKVQWQSTQTLGSKHSSGTPWKE